MPVEISSIQVGQKKIKQKDDAMEVIKFHINELSIQNHRLDDKQKEICNRWFSAVYNGTDSSVLPVHSLKKLP